MKYKEENLPKSSQSHIIQIKNNIEDHEPKKETIILPKQETIKSTLDIYYVNLGKIRL